MLYRLLITATMLLVMAATSHAVMIINIYEDGGKVYATASGALDPSGLRRTGSGGASADAAISPDTASFSTGETAGDYYTDFTASPYSFGANIRTSFDKASTNDFEFTLNRTYLTIGSGYAGEVFDFSGRFNGASLASLGMDVGTYNWEWSSDSIQMNITLTPPVEPTPTPTPEPATLFLLGSGLAGLAATRKKANKA